jgi:hypothetical protein
LVFLVVSFLSIALREEQKPRVFENRILMRIFGPTIDEIKADRKLHNEEQATNKEARKMEPVRSSETSVNFYPTARLLIPENCLFIVTAVRTSDLTKLLPVPVP